MENRIPQTENRDDEEVFAQPKRRKPFEVLRDWVQFKELDEHVEDEEEDDDTPEAAKRGKISRVFRTFFKKNVEKTAVSSAEQPLMDTSFIGNVVELTPAVDRIEETSEQNNDSLPQVESAPTDEVAEQASNIPEQDEAEEDDVTIIAGTKRAAPMTPMPPTVQNAAPNQNLNQAQPVAGNTGANTPPNPGVQAHNAAPVAGGGYNPNLAPQQTFISYERKNGAALAAFIGAEYLSRRRDRKQKERIKDLEKSRKTSERTQKKAAEQIAQMERKMRETTLRQPVAEKIVTPPRRPEQSPTPAVERRPVMPTTKPERPQAPEKQPEAEVSRPQSIKEVLEARQPVQPEKAPELPKLDFEQPKPVERFDQEDILAAAEKLAERANDGTTHEIFDERRHEIKDDKTSPLAAAGVASQSVIEPAPQQTFVSPAPPVSGSTDAARTPSVAETDAKAGLLSQRSALWTALVIGVVFAVMLILFR